VDNQPASLKKRLRKLVKQASALELERNTAMSYLGDFSQRLYAEFERVIHIAEEQGLQWECSIERHNLSDGLESFIFNWDDIGVVLLPARHASLPRPGANLPTGKHQGRVVVYITFDRNNNPATPLGEIYILPDGTWTTLGLPPRNHVQEEVKESDITDFVASLLETLTCSTRFHRNLEPLLLTDDAIRTPGTLGFEVKSLSKQNS
jgi:hypothetical protein